MSSNRPINVNIRLTSAMNLDLNGAIRAGKLQGDLFCRLNGVTSPLPYSANASRSCVTKGRARLLVLHRKTPCGNRSLRSRESLWRKSC
jgi:hypothetical protein